MHKSGFFMSAAALGVTGAVFAQCGNTPTQPVIPQNDAANCGPQDPVDPNGGCNYSSTVPVPFQELGTIGNGAVVRVDGTIGTFTPTGGTSQSSRDLDWFKFTLADNALVSLDLGNFTLNSTVLFLLQWNTSCNDYVQLYGVQGTGTCQSADFALEAGTYVVIATTPFETDPASPSLLVRRLLADHRGPAVAVRVVQLGRGRLRRRAPDPGLQRLRLLQHDLRDRPALLRHRVGRQLRPVRGRPVRLLHLQLHGSAVLQRLPHLAEPEVGG